MSERDKNSGERSIIWVVVMLAVVIALFGWAFAAAFFAHSEEGWRSGGISAAEEFREPVGRRSMRRKAAGSLLDFIKNAFQQIPNMGAVIGHTFRHKWWLVLIVVVLEAAVIAGGLWARRIQQEWNQPRHRSRRK